MPQRTACGGFVEFLSKVIFTRVFSRAIYLSEHESRTSVQCRQPAARTGIITGGAARPAKVAQPVFISPCPSKRNVRIAARPDKNPVIPVPSSRRCSTAVKKSDYPPNADELYRKHFPHVIAQASSKGVRDPENFAQDTLIAALRGFNPELSKFEQRLHFLFRSRLFKEFASRRLHEAAVAKVISFDLLSEPDVAKADLSEDIAAGLKHLRPRDRALIHQRFWKGRTIKKIISLARYRRQRLTRYEVCASYACALTSLRRRFNGSFTMPDLAGGGTRRSRSDLKRPRIP